MPDPTPTDLAAARLEIVNALEKSEDVFREYARQHRAKTPPQEGKALTNDYMAGVCFEALAKAKAILDGQWRSISEAKLEELKPALVWNGEIRQWCRYL